MGSMYNFSKPPKFVIDFFSFFRKWKLGRYKQKKVRKEKTFRNRTYFVKFKIKVDDPINPQVSEAEYEMVIPAKAAFFAKQKAIESIKKKLEFEFVDIDLMTEEQLEYLESTKQPYIDNKKED